MVADSCPKLSDLARNVLGMDGLIETLLATDPVGPSHDDRLNLLIGLDRLASRVAARTQRVLAAIHTDPPPMLPGTTKKIRDKSFVREEVACRLRWSPGVTGTRMHEAVGLVDRHPRALAGVEAGSFSIWLARSLLEATRPLDPAQATKVEQIHQPTRSSIGKWLKVRERRRYLVHGLDLEHVGVTAQDGQGLVRADPQGPGHGVLSGVRHSRSARKSPEDFSRGLSNSADPARRTGDRQCEQTLEPRNDNHEDHP